MKTLYIFIVPVHTFLKTSLYPTVLMVKGTGSTSLESHTDLNPPRHIPRTTRRTDTPRTEWVTPVGPLTCRPVIWVVGTQWKKRRPKTDPNEVERGLRTRESLCFSPVSKLIHSFNLFGFVSTSSLRDCLNVFCLLSIFRLSSVRLFPDRRRYSKVPQIPVFRNSVT